jgi:GNAT superfamily N-acetyltransferase
MADLAFAQGAVLTAILEATYDIWCEGLTPTAYERYYTAQLGTAWGRQHLRRFALVDGPDVLASAKEYTFNSMLDGAAIRVVGLGAVFTQPRHRGQGAARDLIERMLERAAADGADLALLFSEIGADYYARLGFETIAIPDLTLRVTESTRHGAPATLVRAAEDRDLADIVAMNDARARLFRFHLARDRDLVQYAVARKRLLAGLGPAGLREVQFFIAEEGASAVAYVLMTASRRAPGAASAVEWRLEECGDRDPSGARVGAILQTLIARDPAEPRPLLTAWLPPRFCPPQITIVDERPSSDVMMVRALSAVGKAALPIVAADMLYWRSDAF